MIMQDLSRKYHFFTALLAAGVAMGMMGLSGCKAASDIQLAGLEDSAGIITGDDIAPTAVIDSTLGDYLAGNFALETGRIAEAATFFGRALADDPENTELRRQVFLLDLADGRYERALEDAQTLAQQDNSPDEDALLFLAVDHARAGRYDLVSDALARLNDQGIGGLVVPFIDAWASIAAGKSLDEARALLGQGESLGPLNDYHEAMMLLLGDRLEEAASLMAGVLPDSGPAPVRIVQAHAHILAEQGRHEEARQLVGDQLALRDQPVLSWIAAELDAGATPALPFEDAAGGIADAILGIAEALQQERGVARAVLYARLALYLQPDLADASILIGDVLAEQENLESAIALYDSVGESSALRYAARLRKAQLLHQLERKEEAYGLLEEAASVEPDRTDALIELGNLLRREEDYARAEIAYSRAIDRLDEDQRLDWTLFYARGITYERTKRWPQAEADFLHALQLEPDQPAVLNYLGYSWVDMGMNLARAKDMLRRAVELRPEDGFIVDSIGWVHFRLGDYDEAVEELERAVELEPGDPVINDHLGDAYWKVGRVREADFQWRRALTLEPEDDLAAGIRKKLAEGLSGSPS